MTFFHVGVGFRGSTTLPLAMVPSVKDRGEYRFGQLLRWAPGEHPVSQPQRVRAAV